MDSAGRLVIPVEVRRLARLAPGTPLEVRWRDGVIEIEPRPIAVELKRKGHLTVAVPRERVAPLTAEMVDKVRETVRDERESS